MKNSEYWEQRIANLTWETYNNLEEKNKALLEMYQEASLSISDELYRVTEKIQTSTPTLSDMHKFNRLTNLQKNMENIIRDLGDNVESFGKGNMIEGFKDVYSNVMVQLGSTEFDMVPKKVMEEMLKRPWQGGTFSERLWKNTQVLAMNLNDILANGLIQGKTVTEMAIQLNNAMNNGFNVSHRLVRTEVMHYLNESAKKAYKDSRCEEVQLWAAVDERTCKVCGAKHGNIYKIKDCPTLPLHSNCRCTVLPIIDKEDAKRDHDQAKKDINNHFNRRNIPEEKIKQKMKDNYEKDKVQYKKYKEILGKAMSKTFDTFKELKYNNSNEWEELKHNFILFNKETGLQNRLDYMISGESGFIPTNSQITNSKVIAGNGSDTELRSKQMLSDKFGGDVDKWSKKVGKIESDKYVFDIHWNEYEGKQYIVKIKNRKEKKI